MLVPKNRASAKASGSDGSYRPASMELTVCRDTPSALARSACDRPDATLIARTSFRIPAPAGGPIALDDGDQNGGADGDLESEVGRITHDDLDYQPGEQGDAAGYPARSPRRSRSVWGPVSERHVTSMLDIGG
jgi:hypothetical protein